jgi:hypothetical protein
MSCVPVERRDLNEPPARGARAKKSPRQARAPGTSGLWAFRQGFFVQSVKLPLPLYE